MDIEAIAQLVLSPPATEVRSLSRPRPRVTKKDLSRAATSPKGWSVERLAPDSPVWGQMQGVNKKLQEEHRKAGIGFYEFDLALSSWSVTYE